MAVNLESCLYFKQCENERVIDQLVNNYNRAAAISRLID